MELGWAVVGKEFEVYKKALAMRVERPDRMDPGKQERAAGTILERVVELSSHREMSREAAGAVRILHEKNMADRQGLILTADMRAGACADKMGGAALAAWMSLAADMRAGARGTL